MRRVYACVLASGSSGNCVYVEEGEEALLVDCGLTVPELQRRLARIGRSLAHLRAVLITHDHGDHVGSSVALARRHQIPLYATQGTHSRLKRLPPELARVVSGSGVERVGPFDALAISVPHDGIEPVCYRLSSQQSQRSLAVVTDLGYVPTSLAQRIGPVNALVLEMNHDRRMLIEGPYPAMLKARIGGPQGHLSNEDGAFLAQQLLHDQLNTVVLGHLSETNNTPKLAVQSFERSCRDAHGKLQLLVGEQRQVSSVFEV